MSNATESESASAARTNQPAQHAERKDSKKPGHADNATQPEAAATVADCPPWCVNHSVDEADGTQFHRTAEVEYPIAGWFHLVSVTGAGTARWFVSGEKHDNRHDAHGRGAVQCIWGHCKSSSTRSTERA